MQWVQPHRKKRGCEHSRSCPGNGTWNLFFKCAITREIVALNSWRAILITIATIVFSSSSFSSSAATKLRDDFERNFGGKVWEARWRGGGEKRDVSGRFVKRIHYARHLVEWNPRNFGERSPPLARRASATKAVGNSESDSSSYSCGWFPTSYILGFIFASVSPPPSPLAAQSIWPDRRIN